MREVTAERLGYQRSLQVGHTNDDLDMVDLRNQGRDVLLLSMVRVTDV